MADSFRYETPRSVNSLDECAFYHVMDLPGVGQVGNRWDLRPTIEEYFGHFDFAGKRVLDVGAASGFLTYEMEKRGASVVSFDIADGADWNDVPYTHPEYDRNELVQRLKTDIHRIKNAYWFAHRLLESRAQAYYGNIYDLHPGLGDFDVVMFGMVLPHLRDPFLAMQSATRLSRNWAIVTQQSIWSEEPVMQFMPDPETREDPLTWWSMSEGCVPRMLRVLGFETRSVSRAQHNCVVRGRMEHCSTFVAQRIHEVHR